LIFRFNITFTPSGLKGLVIRHHDLAGSIFSRTRLRLTPMEIVTQRLCQTVFSGLFIRFLLGFSPAVVCAHGPVLFRVSNHAHRSENGHARTTLKLALPIWRFYDKAGTGRDEKSCVNL
jgi:hypothetical protein